MALTNKALNSLGPKVLKICPLMYEPAHPVDQEWLNPGPGASSALLPKQDCGLRTTVIWTVVGKRTPKYIQCWGGKRGTCYVACVHVCESMRLWGGHTHCWPELP